MALSAKHRSSIYRSLAPELGEEEAEALLNEFPASEGDELVTKQFLRAELAEFRAQVGEQLRQQTVWLSGLVVAGIGISSTIAAMVT